jgi:predicted aspartyl protease
MRHAARLFAVFVTAIADCWAAGAEPAPGLRFESDGEYVVVRGSIGGRQRLRFLVDTGSTRTVVDRRLASRLGLPLVFYREEVFALSRRVGAQQTVVPYLEFGPVRVESLPVLVMDLRPAGLDVILGLDILRRSSFEIDYRARLIRFKALSETRSSLAFQSQIPLLCVEVTVAGRPMRLAVDTGADRLTLFMERLPLVASRPRSLGAAELVGLGGSTRGDEVELERVQLGGTLFATYHGALVNGAGRSYEGFDGLLGGLSHAVRRVGFDFEHGRLQWE